MASAFNLDVDFHVYLVGDGLALPVLDGRVVVLRGERNPLSASLSIVQRLQLEQNDVSLLVEANRLQDDLFE